MPIPKGSKNKKNSVVVENIKVVEPEAVVKDDPLLPKKSLFRVDEVAMYFQVSNKTIYLWIDHGLLDAEKYSGIIRVPRKSVLSFRLASRINALE